jgi:hypothetical protein
MQSRGALAEEDEQLQYIKSQANAIRDAFPTCDMRKP